jgi:hypothetical protein
MNEFAFTMAHFKVPEPPVSPPEPTDEEYDRNGRNSCRKEAIEAAGTLISRLDELDHDGIHRHTQKHLEDLQEYLENDMED